MEIGFVGFEEAARAFHASLGALDPSLTFSAHDVQAQVLARLHGRLPAAAQTSGP